PAWWGCHCGRTRCRMILLAGGLTVSQVHRLLRSFRLRGYPFFDFLGGRSGAPHDSDQRGGRKASPFTVSNGPETTTGDGAGSFGGNAAVALEDAELTKMAKAGRKPVHQITTSSDSSAPSGQRTPFSVILTNGRLLP